MPYDFEALDAGFRESGLLAEGAMAEMGRRSALSGLPWLSDFVWWMRDQPEAALDDMKAALARTMPAMGRDAGRFHSHRDEHGQHKRANRATQRGTGRWRPHTRQASPPPCRRRAVSRRHRCPGPAGPALRETARRRGTLLRLRTQLSHQARRAGRLPGALQQRWHTLRALRICLSPPLRPGREEAFFHVLPGSETLTFGMLGCDIHCAYCQNWNISQALRDVRAGERPAQVTPEQMVALARQAGARSFASSYNEPLITSEWAMDVFRAAKAAGSICMYVSNGNATREVLEYIRPFTDAYKIDLKSMDARNYRALGAVLENILDAVRVAHELGFWVELVTLLVPGFNDSEAELRDAAQFIRSVSPAIPWHVTAFHQDYRMQDHANTTVDAPAGCRDRLLGRSALCLRRQPAGTCRGL